MYNWIILYNKYIFEKNQGINICVCRTYVPPLSSFYGPFVIISMIKI